MRRSRSASPSTPEKARFPCEFPSCPKTFKHKCHEREHYLTHFSPQFLCHYCPSAFHKRAKLKRHQDKHEGAETVCSYPGCDKSFSRTDSLQRHERGHVNAENRPQLSAEKSERAFSSQLSRREHGGGVHKFKQQDFPEVVELILQSPPPSSFEVAAKMNEVLEQGGDVSWQRNALPRHALGLARRLGVKLRDDRVRRRLRFPSPSKGRLDPDYLEELAFEDDQFQENFLLKPMEKRDRRPVGKNRVRLTEVGGITTYVRYKRVRKAKEEAVARQKRAAAKRKREKRAATKKKADAKRVTRTRRRATMGAKKLGRKTLPRHGPYAGRRDDVDSSDDELLPLKSSHRRPVPSPLISTPARRKVDQSSPPSVRSNVSPFSPDVFVPFSPRSSPSLATRSARSASSSHESAGVQSMARSGVFDPTRGRSPQNGVQDPSATSSSSKSISRERVHILLVDGHQSRFDEDLLKSWADRGLILHTTPPGSTARLQMCDQALNREHQRGYRYMCDDFFYDRLGQPLAKHHAILMFAAAGRAANTKKNILAGWKSIGINPWNPQKIIDTAHHHLAFED